MNNQTETRSLKGTWKQAIVTFLFPIMLVLGVRWALYEPFVIPSGSMIPNLLIHDHILVEKFAFGVHWPFSDRWVIQWNKPIHGDIVVFKYPENPDVYYIKRLIGLPGDKIEVTDGHIKINGQAWQLKPYVSSFSKNMENGFNYYEEFIPDATESNHNHMVRFMAPEVVEGLEPQAFEVPKDMYFFMEIIAINPAILVFGAS